MTECSCTGRLHVRYRARSFSLSADDIVLVVGSCAAVLAAAALARLRMVLGSSGLQQHMHLCIEKACHITVCIHRLATVTMHIALLNICFNKQLYRTQPSSTECRRRRL